MDFLVFTAYHGFYLKTILQLPSCSTLPPPSPPPSIHLPYFTSLFDRKARRVFPIQNAFQLILRSKTFKTQSWIWQKPNIFSYFIKWRPGSTFNLWSEETQCFLQMHDRIAQSACKMCSLMQMLKTLSTASSCTTGSRLQVQKISIYYSRKLTLYTCLQLGRKA